MADQPHTQRLTPDTQSCGGFLPRGLGDVLLKGGRERDPLQASPRLDVHQSHAQVRSLVYRIARNRISRIPIGALRQQPYHEIRLLLAAADRHLLAGEVSDRQLRPPGLAMYCVFHWITSSKLVK